MVGPCRVGNHDAVEVEGSARDHHSSSGEVDGISLRAQCRRCRKHLVVHIDMTGRQRAVEA